MAEKRISAGVIAKGLLLIAAGVAVAIGVADSSDVQPPTISVQPFGTASQIYPAVHDGMTITDGMLRFRADLFDASTIVTPPVLSLDGNALPANVWHSTPGDDGDGEWDWQNWWVLYSGVVADGPHQLSLVASDSLENSVTATYDLNVVTRPTIAAFQPVSYGGVPRPVVSAVVTDANTAVDPGSIALTLDGTAVPHSYDSGSGRVTHVPEADLANESYHTAVLRVADAGGLSATQTWVFYVTTYPDMPDSGIGSCTPCHPAAPSDPATPLLPWEAVHAATLRFGGELHAADGSDCAACHGEESGAKITTPGFVLCGQCHGRPGDWLGYGDGWYHGQHAAIEYVPALRDPAFPVRVARNREMVDCVVCHQPGVRIVRTTGLPAGSHDIPELHMTPPSTASCRSCHARSLTREHARDGSRDRDGRAITCDTCHRSSDATVLGAIATGNTECRACHPVGDSSLSAHHSTCGDCRSCHCY